MKFKNKIKSECLLVTCVRNGENSIEKMKAILSSADHAFEKVAIIIVESDSQDSTLEKIQDWARNDQRVTIISHGDLRQRLPIRTERLAYCRNSYLDHIERHSLAGEFEYMVVFDSDPLISHNFIRKLGVLCAKSLKKLEGLDWICCSGVTLPFYYDIWALRSSVWSPDDCLAQQKRLVQTGVERGLATNISINSRQLSMRGLTQLIPVESAFNGFGIYKLRYLADARYVGVTTGGNEVCEHVAFHAELLNNSPRSNIYIDPELIIGSTPLEHIDEIPWMILFDYVRVHLMKKLQRLWILLSRVMG